jgi:type III pantothenate kinase
MLLVVDVGNTQTHFGVYDGGELRSHWRIPSEREATSDQLATTLLSLLALVGIEADRIQSSIVSATVPALAPQWRALAERYLGHRMLVVGPGIKTGIAIRYENPREIGPDRLVNAVAAFSRYNRSCVVVDFGTAITFDAVSAKGEYLGGLIMPGVEIALEALTERAAALPKVDITAPPKGLIGKSTVEAIRSGILHGTAAAVDGIVTLLAAELGDSPATVATGGMAATVAPYAKTLETVDDLLTLEGLRLLYDRNR